MPNREQKAGERLDRWANWIVGGACVLGMGALLAREADGGSVLPSGLDVILQLPVAAAWLYFRCELLHRPPVGSAKGESRDFGVTLGVLVVATATAVASGRVDLALAMLTLSIAAMLALDMVRAWVLGVSETRAMGPLAGRAVLGWLGVTAIGTAALALPVSTNSAVPDYRHNFWRHVLNCGYTATSATCLVGVSGYDVGEDYSPFGRLVTFGLMQLGGVGCTALGLRAARPMLPRGIRVGRIVMASLAVQAAAGAVLATQWRGEDTPTVMARLAWGVFHAGSALLNCGFALRREGMAAYLGTPVVFVATTGLMVIGSIGLAVLSAVPRVLRGRTEIDGSRAGTDSRRFVNREIAAAFWFLLVGAVVLFFCETPGMIPESLTPTRPLDLGPRQVPLREMSARGRWSAAMFVTADARSCGMAGVPLAEGAINWASLAMLCAWMSIGGGVASFAGGLRCTTLLMLGSLWFADRSDPAFNMDAAARRWAIRRLFWLVAGMAVLTATSIGGMFALQEAQPWERILDGWAAASCVGWTAGLAPHLTWPARCLMIAVMLTGRLFPLLIWCSVGGILARCAVGQGSEGAR